MPDFRAPPSGSDGMGERIARFDWAATPLGPREHWPQSLRTALALCLHSAIPTAIYWGSELILLHNDAWSVVAGERHPGMLGKPAGELWSDFWHLLIPRLRVIMETGQGWSMRDEALEMELNGVRLERFWDSSFAPIIGEQGKPAGVFAQSQETTGRVLAQRRSVLLIEVNDRLRTMNNVAEMAGLASELLARSIGAAAVGYAEADVQNDRARVVNSWSRGDMLPLGGIYSGHDYGQGVAALTGNGEPICITDVEDDPRIQSQEARANWRAIGARSAVVAPLMHDGTCRALMFALDNRPRAWTKHQIELLRIVALRVSQEIARARAEIALRSSEERHRLIFEQAHDIIFTADLDQIVTSCNPAAAAAFGATPDQLIGRSIAEFVTPEHFQQTTAMLQHKLDRGGTTQHDIEVIAAPGRILLWEISSSLATDSEGNIIGLQAIARDVTERKAFEAQQQLLINELNHRVKNTLALVQGLALQTFKAGRDPASARVVFQERLAALAAAHDLLTREKWEGATLGELVTDALRVHADPPERISISGPRVVVSPKAAISLVLAMHELGTNAAKYGALSVPGGRVEVDWSLLPGGTLRIQWRELGGPPVKAPHRSGFGLRMIERALKSDLAGSVKVLFDPGGLVCTIDAPDPALTMEAKTA